MKIISEQRGKNIILWMKGEKGVMKSVLRLEDNKITVMTHPYYVTEKIVRSEMTKFMDQRTAEAVRLLRKE